MKATYKDENGIVLDLPKQTVEMYEMRERVKEQPNGVDSFRTRYQFLKAALPADYLDAYLQGEIFEDCDVTALAVCYRTVCNAYDLPELKAQMANVEAVVRDMKPAVDMAATMSKAQDKGANRQGFAPLVR